MFDNRNNRWKHKYYSQDFRSIGYGSTFNLKFVYCQENFADKTFQIKEWQRLFWSREYFNIADKPTDQIMWKDLQGFNMSLAQYKWSLRKSGLANKLEKKDIRSS